MRSERTLVGTTAVYVGNRSTNILELAAGNLYVLAVVNPAIVDLAVRLQGSPNPLPLVATLMRMAVHR